MLQLRLTVEACTGTTIERAIQDALILAHQLNIGIALIFNDTEIILNTSTTVEEAKYTYDYLRHG